MSKRENTEKNVKKKKQNSIEIFPMVYESWTFLLFQSMAIKFQTCPKAITFINILVGQKGLKIRSTCRGFSIFIAFF